MNEYTLTRLFQGKTRLQLHFISLIALFFLLIYNRRVCPCINGLHVSELIINLLIVFFFQALLREWLFRFAPWQFASASLPRKGYYLSVIVWLVAGVVALNLHLLRYPDFPFGSHLKLLSSYWFLGAGMLAQWEYVLLERAERRLIEKNPAPKKFLESLTRRIMEGYFLFTLVPALVMLLVVLRYVDEKLIGHEVALEIAYFGLFCLAVALLVAALFGKGLHEDTKKMVESLKEIEQGKFSTMLAVNRPDELGEMSNGINLMANGLQQRERIKEAFGRFVAPSVAEEFIEKYVKQENELMLGVQRREVVILMTDIRDFTPLAEAMQPEELTSLLNSYFCEMVAVIQLHGGMVDKFIGDAIMAVFGMVGSEKNPALAAVRAAIEMQDRLKSYNFRNLAQGKPSLRTGIGIHMGEVVAGYIGSTERLEFTVIGTPVNIAARIESKAKLPNPPILFSQEIADKVKGIVPTKHVVKTLLKGYSTEVNLYSVTSI
ncbi:adenylate/guanylate cyclase with integral membrane sensor [Chloroherpeton thalassium ATCC 35110]|uniref:Adenylate/guanylate cyclase with integral membrane sensor n=1 Tax=Chloroherpeton thalassium (strain ATCC 35110 / GB-78) TaxID=517418 RepID=B3QRY7_CHLT3|nr:adenylate/guanylate cyclase domain-containing protein [Chloroherpeton thalassium]ACF13940.1 adenylate/guanylate cyclase with integral membrane sensor [Chloroherpeton thalassium ATCC 35110]